LNKSKSDTCLNTWGKKPKNKTKQKKRVELKGRGGHNKENATMKNKKRRG